jgi:hypothetical protein
VATPTAKAAPEPETTGQHVQRWLRSVAEYWRLSVICSFERIRPVKAPSSESPNTKESSA